MIYKPFTYIRTARSESARALYEYEHIFGLLLIDKWVISGIPTFDSTSDINFFALTLSSSTMLQEKLLVEALVQGKLLVEVLL